MDVTFTMEMKDVQQAMQNVTFAIKQDTSAICATNVVNRQQASVNELNNQTILKSLQGSRHRDKNMDLVDLLDVYNHYDKDCAELARSLNCLEMETLQMQHKNLCYTHQFQKVP